MMATQDWLLKNWVNLFGEAISSMAGHAVTLSIVENQATDEQVIWWSQKFNLGPQESVWVGAPKEVWNSVGKLALIGAGIDDPSDDDIEGTYLELVQQALSKLAQAIGQQLMTEVTCSEGKMGAEAPVSTRFSLSLDCNGQSIAPYMIAFSASLLATLQAKALAATTPEELSIPRSQEQQFETRNGIELLLDVELPVGVSFGKAILPLKDVIKLTSGSIVELNRSINEPVEVIVNNCVIAKGEVVVVDGNYGVRIHHIVSRQERLRSIH